MSTITHTDSIRMRVSRPAAVSIYGFIPLVAIAVITCSMAPSRGQTASRVELPATSDSGTTERSLMLCCASGIPLPDGGAAFSRTLVESVLRGLLNEMVLAATRKGLFQAYNVLHQFPNEWIRLKQTKSSLTLGQQHLPHFA